jgi:hypothetical protein
MAKRPSLVGKGSEALASKSAAQEKLPLKAAPMPDRSKPEAVAVAKVPEPPVITAKPRIAPAEIKNLALPLSENLSGAGAIFGELAGFANTMWRYNLDAGVALGKCKDPVAVFAVQADYLRKIAQCMTDESLKLINLSVRAARAR